jgi:MFS transporter, PPP family, 3-phenylpropionic acid transporter
MTNNQDRPVEIVISSQYFLYFLVMGAFLPFFNLYCFHVGFSGFQIGVISALRSLVMVLFPMLWGFIAGRFRSRWLIYILCSMTSCWIWAFFAFTTDFQLMLVITFFYSLFYAPIIAFLEAFTMDVLGRGKRRYGRIRAWGSVSFIVTVLVLGKAIDLFSIRIILAVVFAGSLLQAALAFGMPKVAAEEKESPKACPGEFTKPRLLLFLFCAFLMLVSHGTYYGFFSIHLEKMGHGGMFIGLAWALASTAEIGVMIGSKKIFDRFSIETILTFSFVMAAFRWFGFFFVVSWPGILLLQLLHAFTYGTFHMASILYMDRVMSFENKTMGQSVNNAVTYGLGLMVGFYLNGFLYKPLGIYTLFAISGCIALTGGLIFQLFSSRLEDPSC